MENENEKIVEEQQKVEINQSKLNQYIEQLRLEQNLPLGLIGGIIASLAGAILWAAITVATEYQIGYMAVAVGLMVGFTIRYLGKGMDKIFGISSAILSLLGCLIGNFLSIIGFFANAEGLGYMEALNRVDFSLVPSVMLETFSPMDILFYGIAVYEGYKFSFRKITEEEIIQHATV